MVDTVEEVKAVVAYLTGHMRDLNEAKDGTATYSNLLKGSEARASYLDGFFLVTGLNLSVAAFGVA